MKPLEDIRVLDLSRVYAAPAGAMLLADMGADVIRVEAPGGTDSMREWGPFINGESAYYFTANRNKRSITLNLKEQKGKALFFELLKTADVVIENFKTGTMEKLGLSFEKMKEVNPKIICCSVTGYGHTGPLKNEPGFDPVIQALSGLMDVTGDSDGEATKVGVPISDVLTSVYVALSVTAAVRQRDQTGKGQEIDLSLLDVQLSGMANVASAYLNVGLVSKRLGNRHNNVAPYQLFQARDAPIMICVGTDSMFRNFTELLGQPEWGEDPRFLTNEDRKQNELELIEEISKLIAIHDAEQWLEKLSAAGIPAGRVNTIAEALEQEQVQAREAIEVLPHATVGQVKMIKNPIRFSQLHVENVKAPPILGEHTKEVYFDLLGLTEEEIKKLRMENVI